MVNLAKGFSKGRMEKSAKKMRVYKEEIKVTQTTHWDMDYLPKKEVDALYDRAPGVPAEAPRAAKENSGSLGLILVIIGVVGLVLSLFLIAWFRVIGL